MLPEDSASIRRFTRSNWTLLVGIVAAIAGISIQSALMETWAVMQECTERLVTINGKTYNAYPPGGGEFYPGSIRTVSCNYQENIGQDLTFWARIYVDADLTPMPTHLKITNPEGDTVFEKDFKTVTVVAQIQPQSFGNYTATITNTQDPPERVKPRGLGYHISYAFGHLTSHYTGVSNAIGDVISGLLFWSHFMVTGGIILVLYWLARAGYRNLKKSRGVEYKQ